MGSGFSAYTCCSLCPRACGADRAAGECGACGCDDTLRIARAALHYWEEPPVSGTAGSGAIFFSGCPLTCVYCQNHEISRGLSGEPVTVQRLARIMLELEGQGALNINLVTPTHFAPHVIAAAKLARGRGLAIPLVCNTSGYETRHAVEMLSEVVDVWLTDYKYVDPDLGMRLSHVADYDAVASSALARMVSIVESRGGRTLGSDGRLLQGIIVRHLVLPAHVADSCAVLDRVWEICGNAVDISVMNQYTPNALCADRGGDLARCVSPEEYELVLDHADALGFDRMWWQESGTVSESFVPPFDNSGVLGPELR
ncbi:radical SAM protein [Coriobacteriales bacterium OH1046]|nr:radical SAM protein [Coriobacteriales bacterium OH1046]